METCTDDYKNKNVWNIGISATSKTVGIHRYLCSNSLFYDWQVWVLSTASFFSFIVSICPYLSHSMDWLAQKRTSYLFHPRHYKICLNVIIWIKKTCVYCYTWIYNRFKAQIHIIFPHCRIVVSASVQFGK